MIVKREFTKNINKKILADLASNYATEFARLLGYEGDVIIEPKELIYDREEALNFFLKKPEYKTGRRLYYINQRSAFVSEGYCIHTNIGVIRT